MAPEAPFPVLPHGSPSLLSGFSETFSFHASPESFIASRAQAFWKKNPGVVDSRAAIRARILNRNVAVISSYHHVIQILQGSSILYKISAGSAYDELMAPFFPPPNLLLSDLPENESMKTKWQSRMASLPSKFRPMIIDVTVEHFGGLGDGATVDLYECMKSLSWKLLLRIFIAGIDGSKVPAAELLEIERLQEDLLRGQFSLFPVSVSAGFWQSPRAKGLAARKQLQALLARHMKRDMNGCPFAVSNADEESDVANHLLLFTSSLAAKALASSLTALILNLFVFPQSGQSGAISSLAHDIACLQDEEKRDSLIRSIILETERLSPPVVGIMRRTKDDVVLEASKDGAAPTLIPRVWDLWIYFVGAARDPAVFGGTAETFVPDRYCAPASEYAEAKEGFAFGVGPKSCLGRDLMREVAFSVAKSCIGPPTQCHSGDHPLRVEAKAEDIPAGVQAYLGWKQDPDPTVWARDMKQLPVQRPKKAIMVTINRQAKLAEAVKQ
ncbi:MAG: hypothetical protein L6R39_007362 [Caloplaca ligustica]|nr:MAG: hypothetical protein L6R39_007362 [Caloplaca ligustica]